MKAVIKCPPEESTIKDKFIGYRISGAFKHDPLAGPNTVGFQQDFVVQLLASSKLNTDATDTSAAFPKFWTGGALPLAGAEVELAINAEGGVGHTFKKIKFLGATEMSDFNKGGNKERMAFWLLTFKYAGDNFPGESATVSSDLVKNDEQMHSLAFAKCNGGLPGNSKMLLALRAGIHGDWYFAHLQGLRSKTPDWMSLLLQADKEDKLDANLALNGEGAVANLHLEVTAGANSVKLILIEEVWGAFHSLSGSVSEDGYRYFLEKGETPEGGEALDKGALDRWLFRFPDLGGSRRTTAGQASSVERVSIWTVAKAAQKQIILAGS